MRTRHYEKHDFTKPMMPGMPRKAYDRFVAPKSFMKPRVANYFVNARRKKQVSHDIYQTLVLHQTRYATSHTKFKFHIVIFLSKHVLYNEDLNAIQKELGASSKSI
jgi:hypothetical protein